MITLIINDKPHDVDVDPDTPLLWLREWIGMTDTKYGAVSRNATRSPRRQKSPAR
jgi:aerobic-type carbon monoxide dehydrogenase small subunit (CoxS/CutS family)